MTDKVTTKEIAELVEKHGLLGAIYNTWLDDDDHKFEDEGLQNYFKMLTMYAELIFERLEDEEFGHLDEE